MCPALQTGLHNRDEVGGAVCRLEVPCRVTPKYGGGEQEGTSPILLTLPNHEWALSYVCMDVLESPLVLTLQDPSELFLIA